MPISPSPTIDSYPTYESSPAIETYISPSAQSPAGTVYRVYISSTSGGPYTLAGSYTPNTEVGPLGPVFVANIIISGLTATHTYYVVGTMQYPGYSESAYSSELSVTAENQTAVPTAVTLTPSQTTVSAAITATAGGTLRLYRIVGGTFYGTVVTGTSSPLVDTGLNPSTLYEYYVTNQIPPNLESGSFSVSTTTLSLTAFTAPASITATAGVLQVALSCASVTSATRYYFYRSTTSGGTYSLIGSNASPAYTDTAVTGGTTYYYKAAAIGTGYAISAQTAYASATPTSPTTTTAPSSISATAGVGNVSLSCASVSGATVYKWYRGGTNTGPWTLVGSSSTNAFVDTTGVVGTSYYYAVTATVPGDLESTKRISSSAYASTAPSGGPSVQPYSNLYLAGSTFTAGSFAYGPFLVDKLVNDETTGYSGS